jgi:hypothetical protein
LRPRAAPPILPPSRSEVGSAKGCVATPGRGR